MKNLLLISLVLVTGSALAQPPAATKPSKPKPVVKTAPKPDQPTVVTLHLSGLKCSVCETGLRSVLKGLPGVVDATVSAANQTAVVALAAKNAPKPDALAKAARDSGFTVVKIDR
jgi:copper chaperone CopZ